jgi:hypothetical protein
MQSGQSAYLGAGSDEDLDDFDYAAAEARATAEKAASAPASISAPAS